MKGEHKERHPPGLYVLFFTEMWERFGFYSMLAMFALYLQGDDAGVRLVGGGRDRLYANYLMFVYASPLIGGWIADKKLGYRNSVLIGGVIFMVGYLLLAIRSIAVVYAALALPGVGNGFFKPNVSAMVGHLYPEGAAAQGPGLQHLLHGHQHRRLPRNADHGTGSASWAAAGSASSRPSRWPRSGMVDLGRLPVVQAVRRRPAEAPPSRPPGRGRATPRSPSPGRHPPAADGRPRPRSIEAVPDWEADPGADRHLPHRHRLLDGVPPERLGDVTLLYWANDNEAHRTGRPGLDLPGQDVRRHLERHQPVLGRHAADVPAGLVLAAGKTAGGGQGTVDADEDRHRHVADRRGVLTSWSLG